MQLFVQHYQLRGSKGRCDQAKDLPHDMHRNTAGEAGRSKEELTAGRNKEEQESITEW
jgi:hypothetical protein